MVSLPFAIGVAGDVQTSREGLRFTTMSRLASAKPILLSFALFSACAAVSASSARRARAPCPKRSALVRADLGQTAHTTFFGPQSILDLRIKPDLEFRGWDTDSTIFNPRPLPPSLRRAFGRGGGGEGAAVEGLGAGEKGGVAEGAGVVAERLEGRARGFGLARRRQQIGETGATARTFETSTQPSSCPPRCAATLLHGQSSGRSQSTARTGLNARYRTAARPCASSIATQPKRPWNRGPVVRARALTKAV